MTPANVDIARRAVAAVLRREKPDFETINALFALDHEFVSILSEIEGRSWRGAVGYRDFLGVIGDSLDYDGRVESAVELDANRVLVEAIVTTRGKSSEVTLSEPRWVVMTIQDGKVTRTETYASRAEAL